MLVTSILSFSHGVFYPIKEIKKIIILTTYILLSANSLTVDQAKILLSGKRLNDGICPRILYQMKMFLVGWLVGCIVV